MKQNGKPSLKDRFMSLFRPQDEEREDIHYNGRPMRRLVGYLKPHRKVFVLCLCMVLALTVLELVRPMIIGNAIDRYITGETSETLQAEGRTEWEPGEQADQRFEGVLIAAGMYLAVLLLVMILNRTQTMMLQRMGQDIIYEIRN